MENFRSMSCREGRMQMDNYNDTNFGRKSAGGPPTSMQDLRSYSTSYASNMQVHPQPSRNDVKNNSNKNGDHHKKNKAGGSSSSAKGWSLSDPEIQRKRRVASYKVYAVEGKMKGSFKKSFRWIKHTCSHAVGWW